MDSRSFVALFFATQISFGVSLGAFIFLRALLDLGPKIWSHVGWGLLLLSLGLPSGVLWYQIQRTPLTEVATPLISEALGQPVLISQVGLDVLPLTKNMKERATLYRSKSPGILQTMTWAQLLTLIWILFCVPFLLLRFLDFLRLFPVLKRTHLFRRVGRVSISASDYAGVPMCFSLFGWSYILIPSSLLTSPRDLKLALLHELQHLKMRDPAYSFFLDLLIPFFGPLLWLWRAQMIELQELSCDRAVLRRRGVTLQDYVGCLLRVAETALSYKERSALSFAGTAWLGGSPQNPKQQKIFLQRRIEIMFSKEAVSQWSKIGTRGLTTLLGGLVGIMVISGVAAGALRPSLMPAINAGGYESDPAILKIAEEELQAAVLLYKAREAFAIVAEPETGRVLAVAQAQGGLSARQHASSLWPIQNLVEPAALLKPLLLAQGIEEGKIALEEEFDCEHGNYRVGNRIHHDWSDKYGLLNSRKIVSHSSNIGGIKFAQKLGQASVAQFLQDYGFGHGGSAAHFGGARVGYVLNPEQLSDSEQWLPLVASGFTALYLNPLELVQSFSAIASGGKLMRAISNDAAVGDVHELRQVMSAETAWKMRQVLFESATSGTGGNNGVSALYTSGGKTGTNYHPRVPQHDAAFGGDENVAHYVGFSPLLAPKVTVYVGIINPTDRLVMGSKHAAPVFKRISERVLQHLGVKPDQPRNGT